MRNFLLTYNFENMKLKCYLLAKLKRYLLVYNIRNVRLVCVSIQGIGWPGDC